MNLEQRVEALEKALAAMAATPAATVTGAGEYWMLDGVRERHPDGAIVYAGSAELPTGGEVAWQYGATPDDIAASDWTELAGAFDALGSPVRLKLLQLIHGGVTTSAALAARDDLGSTGQIHHHLRALVAAGWLAHRARGEYVIPTRRVVPLLVCLLAANPT